MSRKVKKSNAAHFTFGNEERVMKSSYSYDYNRAFIAIRDKKMNFPSGAQVNPA